MKRYGTAGLAGVCALLAACNNHGNQDVLNSAGIQAHRIEHLWWLIFWVTLTIFVLVLVFLGSAIWQRNDAGMTSPPEPHQKDREARLSVGVSAAVLITIVILFVLLVASISTGKAVASLQSKHPVTIEVTGHQWWWEVHYPDPIAGNIVVTANEIHVPVGVPVVLNSTSQDVIHSFWAPNIDGKRDLIPGYQTAVWFQADREGVFRGQCAEFCGHQHAHMAFFLIAEAPDKFQAWLQHQRQPSSTPTDPVALHGQQVFLSSTCVMCHTIRGTEAGSKNGPDLTHLASRGTIAAGTLPNTPGNLAGWILDSQSIKPGNHMPPNSFSSDDLQALLTYLEGLQ
jgi:cytochrome c oxidase subunit II